VVLRHPWFVTALLLTAFVFATDPSRDARVAGTASTLPTTSTCPASPSGAEPDVVEPTATTTPPDYSVTVTRQGTSPVTWMMNTNGHTAAFTVKNTGACDDGFALQASASGGNITGLSVSPASAGLSAGDSITVTITYNVTVPGSGLVTLTGVGQGELREPRHVCERDNGAGHGDEPSRVCHEVRYRSVWSADADPGAPGAYDRLRARLERTGCAGTLSLRSHREVHVERGELDAAVG
jgi:hypothetical protein